MAAPSFKQEMAYIAARLEEKSTYAGLMVVLSLGLPVLAKYVPQLANTDASSIANDISMIGISVGSLMAIFLPETVAAAN